MSRALLIVCALALGGIATALSLPFRFYARLHDAEAAAVAALVKIGEAQRMFRNRAGRLGYASELASLTTPCPGELQSLLQPSDIQSEYNLVMRPEASALRTGTDCHGRQLVSDYYVGAQPPADFSGAQAFAMTARGRIYVFFDGLAPREGDMVRGGLAVPFDRLETFRIP